MSATAATRLQADTMRPLMQTGRLYYAFIGFLLIVIGWGMFAYTRQLSDGLAVTGMRDKVSWGLYITNFVFFIGISHAGTLISAILRLTHAEWRRPITRMAEVITVVALLTGALFPIFDLGRPDRIPNLIMHGRLSSPIIWDFISISTYLTGSIIYLYLPMIPDLAICRDRLKGSTHRFRAALYRTLAIGWKNTAEQRRRLDIALAVMMILIIPIAISVHTVVSWIFAMTMRSGWNSTIFGPYFVVGAIFSGVAAIITVMWIFRKAFHLEEYITATHFKYLGFLLLALDLIYAYFTLAEYLTTGYKLETGDKALLEELMTGRYASFFWAFVVGGMLIPALLIAFPKTRTPNWIFFASILVNIGMWLKRWVIVVPSMALPLMPYEWGTYWPTWVEISVSMAALAWFALLFALFAKFFPIISMWEVEEALEPVPESAPVMSGGPSLGLPPLPAMSPGGEDELR